MPGRCAADLTPQVAGLPSIARRAYPMKLQGEQHGREKAADSGRGGVVS